MAIEFEWIGVLRHGQSTGNVARDEAESAGRELIDIPERDADVPLTALGREQAATAGATLVERPPDVVVASSYVRAVDTARIAVTEAARHGADISAASTLVDERLRDRELGVLDLHTARGVAERWPDEFRRKRRLGKFYYRPPGGESWADVVLRIRSLLGDLNSEAPGGKVLLVAHEMSVFALRYLLEGLDEHDLLQAAARTEIANGSITGWQRDGRGRYVMTTTHEIAPSRGADAKPSTDDDVPAQLV